jgi:hypothetical protein
MTKSNSRDPEGAILKELQRIRNLLMILLMRQGARLEELDVAVRMGAGNIRRMLPAKKMKRAKE